MNTIIDVARYIVYSHGNLLRDKLQKLCYYSQAWSLALTGNPLFTEDFESWPGGPINNELHAVRPDVFMLSEWDIGEDISNLSSEQQKIIDKVMRDYSHMSQKELLDLSRSESPWQTLRIGLTGSYPCHENISHESMRDYYGARLRAA